MKKVKILFVISSFGIGGKERQLIELIKALPKDKYEIYFFTKSISEFNLSQVRNSLASLYLLKKDRLSGLKSLKEFAEYIQEIKPVVIHSWTTETSVYAVLARLLYRKKFLLIEGGIRDAWFPYHFWSKDYMMRRFVNYFSDIIVSNSKAGTNNYLVPEKKAMCIYNGYNFNRTKKLVSKSEIQKRFGLGDFFVVGMVARFFNQKDWLKYIDIANHIIKSNKKIVFVCVGGGPELERVQAYAKNSENVIFTNEQDDILSIVNCFDIGLLITDKNHHAEGIPNSIMEYMSMKKPSIANDAGGTREILEDNQTGLLVYSNTVEEFSEKIMYLYKHPEVRKRLGENSRTQLEHKFDLCTMVNQFQDIYKKVKKN
ncbi:MAG: glycosyltransferase family 4 protein [Bacteroidales bacterium]|nr:glycosyltransferase family 4 protein [Bacteroidales bacterium]